MRRASLKAEQRAAMNTTASLSENAENGKVTEDKGSEARGGGEGGGGVLGGIPGSAEELAAKLEELQAADDEELEDDNNLGWSHPQSKRSSRQRSDASASNVADVLGSSSSSMRSLFGMLGKTETKIAQEPPPMPTIPGSFMGGSGAGIPLIVPPKSKEELLAEADNFDPSGLESSTGPPTTKSKSKRE